MHLLVYLSLCVSAGVAVFAVFKPDKLRPVGRLTWTGRLTILATIVAFGVSVNAQWVQDRRDQRARDERFSRMQSIQNEIIWCFDSGFLANLKLLMLDHCTEDDWRRLSQATNIVQIGHATQLRREPFDEAVRPLLIPLAYTRMLDTAANLRGTPLPDGLGERTWRDILVANLDAVHQRLSEASRQHAQFIPFDVQRDLQNAANLATDLADFYRKHDEEKAHAQEYIRESVPYLLYATCEAHRRLIRLRAGEDAN